MNLYLIQHELNQIFCNRKSWYSLAIIQTILGLIFNWLLLNFIKNQAITHTMHYGITEEVLHPFYAWYALLMLVLLPMFITQIICAEKQNGTIINYYCAPIKSSTVIFNKYISLNILLLISLCMASIMPLWITVSGKLDWGQFLATFLGVYLMLSAAQALCVSVAAFMTNTIRANITIFVTLAGIILLEWAAQFAGKHTLFLQEFALLKPLKPFLAGIINIRAIAYYLLLMLSFLSLAVWRFSRRWQNV